MGKFDGVLLASDFDNTLVYTEDALQNGEAVPPLPERNRQALEYFITEQHIAEYCENISSVYYLEDAQLYVLTFHL